MQSNPAVVFGTLNRDESLEVLQRNHIGRLAYSLHDRVEIEPISYVCDGEWILIRTSHGSKTAKIRHHRWVAFQIDEIQSHTNWTSVVVHGSIQEIANDGPTDEHEAFEQTILTLRQHDPDALSARDATPHRVVLLRLHIDELTGRFATTQSK